MAPHIAQMVANIAADLDVAEDCINIKATTTEKLGFTGRGEGIATQAVCLLEKRL
jgi:2-C-methyl-D-erythritol 2,4-cyclodiphosphate synthase